MASQDQWKAFQDEDRITKAVKTPRLLWIDRPILLHGRREKPGPRCDCGCGSRLAYVIERREHISLLLNRITGVRKLRSRLVEQCRGAFDKFVRTKAKRLYMPLRCYAEQLPVLFDRKAKIILVGGGSRAGKTQLGVEWLTDRWCEDGGLGSEFWVVSSDLTGAQVIVKKFCRGQRAKGRFLPPIFPADLVLYYPKTKNKTDQTIRLIDGSTIPLKHAGKGDGDHLKADNCMAILADEASSYSHESAWNILLSRLLDAGGQMLAPTTPKAGHFLQLHAANAATYEQAAEQVANGGRYPDFVKLEITCFDNVWQDPEEIQRDIRAKGGEDSPWVQREVYGKWVGNGRLLWRCFNEDRNVIEMASRNVERHGYVNLTDQVVRYIWGSRTDASNIRFVAGMDFNCDPMSLAIGRVLCPKDVDLYDPQNWILYIEDEVIKKRCASAHDFAEFVLEKAGVIRSLPQSHFAGLHVVCDGTGFFKGQRGAPAHHRPDAVQMESHGFRVRAPVYEKGKPKNPPRLSRHAFVNELLFHGRLQANGARCSKLIESWKMEQDNGKGDTLKRSDTLADQRSGITDAVGYLAWAVMYRADEIAKAIKPQAATGTGGLAAW